MVTVFVSLSSIKGAYHNEPHGSFFAGLSGYATNNRFQKAVFCGTLIMSRNMGVRDLTEAIYLLKLSANDVQESRRRQNK